MDHDSEEWKISCLGNNLDIKTFEKRLKESTGPSGVANFRSMVYDNFENLPETLKLLFYGFVCEGEINTDISEKPDWFDPTKLCKGQEFARKHIYAVSFASSLSLFTLFSFPDGLKPLIITGKSGTPFTAFKRYLSTGWRVLNWYTYDLWENGSQAYNDISVVRKMHTNIRKKLTELSKDDIDIEAEIENAWSPSRSILLHDFQSACPAFAPGQCPYRVLDCISSRFKPLSQGEMTGTQFGFVGLVVLYPKAFGLHDATEDDLDAFCHVWRNIGYLLGIQDEFNICRGSLSDVRKRCADFLEFWVKPNLRDVTPEWEHMSRCFFEGSNYYFSSNYESSLLYFTDVLNLHMPRLKAKTTLTSRIRYIFLKIMFKYIVRIPGVSAYMAKSYHRKLEKAKAFDEDKLISLEKRSVETLEEYRRKMQQN